jgi:hypothetical protein
MSLLDTFVADCLRIIIERKAREVAEYREKALRAILNQERNQLP